MAHENESDELTRRTHISDQLTGFLREQAQQAAAYFKELQHQGFSRPEALQLSLIMQTERFRSLYSMPPKPET